MDKEQKDAIQKDIQWHPAFVSAMNLEFTENREDLVFEREYNLNTKPLEIDLLIIKKEKDIQIRNEIGSFFRKYNGVFQIELTKYKKGAHNPYPC